VTFPIDKTLKQLDDIMICDRFRLRGRVLNFQKNKENNEKAQQIWQQLVADINKSYQRAQARQQQKPVIEYPQDLPIVQKRADIAEAILKNQVVVIAGETGSGKTTQLPKICLDIGRGINGMIGHTQPRRLAARMVATRVAEELKTSLGAMVGYQVRFTDQVSDGTFIKLMTDGILLAEISNDPFLEQYDTIIIDEAHERSLNIDFLLGYIKRILPKRPELKVIITSATIDVEKFARHFNNAPIIEVSGRTYPVETWYRPAEYYFTKKDEEAVIDEDFSVFLIKAVQEIIDYENNGGKRGDILIFLSGERDIREVSHAIKKAQWRDTEVLPLYARLSATEQNRVFAPHAGRRIVLSTNVAETSLTVPGIRYVIDPGWARINRYSYRTKVQRLPIEAISQASANQRKGRCGRVSEGICLRLYSESDFLSRPAFTDPEIIRTDLASVILRMLYLRLGDIEHFPFIDMPDARFISDGFKTLYELQAVDSKNNLTPLGKQLAQIPIDVRVGRMLLAAASEGALSEILIITSALSIQDPRERPVDHQQQSDEKHRRYWNNDSDFMAYLTLWDFYEQARQTLTQNKLRAFCREHFLSYLRMREWRDIHTQLHLACEDLRLKENELPAEYNAIHRALLAGLLGNVGYKSEDNEYVGARNRKFYLFPASSVFKKQPKWVLSAELVETQRVYARCVAKIDPEWIEPLAKHIVKRHYFEPHWEKQRGQVIAFEQVILYGLMITSKRKVHYGPIDPAISRDIFIREALVEGHLNSNAGFFVHNQRLLDDVDELEAKARKRDIVVEPQTLFSFYDEHIPDGIYNEPLLNAWLKTQQDQGASVLFLTREALLKRDALEVTHQEYPDFFEHKGMRFALRYHFHPGDQDDGVTLTVPTIALNQLPLERLEWLVPGMLRAKCEALLRSLPKQLRKNFVPVPNFVDALMNVMSITDQSLTQTMTEHLSRMTGVKISSDAWQLDLMDAHHFMNYQILDEHGNTVAMGRDVALLQQQLGAQLNVSAISDAANSEQSSQTQLTQWSFGELKKTEIYQQAGLTITLYPAIIDDGRSVSIRLIDNELQAIRATTQGVTRLIYLTLLSLFKDNQKYINQLNESKLLYSKVSDANSFFEELILATILKLLDEQLQSPRTESTFLAVCLVIKNRWIDEANKINKIVFLALSHYQKINKTLNGSIPPAWMLAIADIKEQLHNLFDKRFLTQTPFEWLQHYPRYIQAIASRLDKLSGQLPKDRQLTLELADFWKAYLARQSLEQNDDLIRYRWLIEEYRVSLFSQSLGTSVSVSAKKLKEQLNKIA
jgi:ATP-dependent helicase HrpA